MWWLDPGKEVLNILFNRILAPYIENLDMNQVNYGIGQGQLTLRNLRLKRGALDKFRLPVDVLEGYLGQFTLSLHWMNLGNQPVQILIEDVYLLVVPSSESKASPEEEEQRIQAAKAERLENAELLHMRGQAEESGNQQQQGLLASLTAKIVNNLQVTVKNIHVRYEDKLSVPGHPFATGVTLAGFTAVSVNDKWIPAFIDSTAGAIHKLANLESLSMYFDTDSPSMAGLPPAEAIKKFTALIATNGHDTSHQFILRPVSGEGRVILNHKLNKDTPRFDVQLLFDEIGIALDNNQYRDAISLVDMYHVYLRQHQYRKFRPSEEEFSKNRPQALLQFAGKAILDGVHERHRKWTWAYFRERRDDRNSYVELFKKKSLNQLIGSDVQLLEALERKLSYEDIRFYRSIARSKLKKDLATRRELEEQKRATVAASSSQNRGWGAWLWGSRTEDTSETSRDDAIFGGTMTEQQRKELYEVLDYDEKSALAESFEAPRDALKLRVGAQLKKGSFALKSRSKKKDVISIEFDVFQATAIQRTDGLDLTMSLGGFGVFDGTTENTLYPQIVRVASSSSQDEGKQEITILPVGGSAKGKGTIKALEDPFLQVKLEQNPLDERADTGLTVKMRPMEIIYHRGYIEAIYNFFKPPESQLESVEALLDAASQTLEEIQKETRAGLEAALQAHKTVDIQMDMSAPIIIIPEDITRQASRYLIVDAGHIAIESNLVDKSAVKEIRQKRGQQYSLEDYKRLESLMYDNYSVKLHAAQFVLGNDLQSCRNALASEGGDSLHLLERINIDLTVQNSIVPTVLNLARFKVFGKLPSLQVNFSDEKYHALMRFIEVCMPRFDENEGKKAPEAIEPKAIDSKTIRPNNQEKNGAFRLSTGVFRTPGGKEYNVTYDEDEHEPPENEEFFDVEDTSSNLAEIHQHIFELDFQVEELKALMSRSTNNGEQPVGSVSLNKFGLDFALAKFDMKVHINLRSLSMDLVRKSEGPITFMTSSSLNPSIEHQDLLTVEYNRVQKDSPEYQTVFEGMDQSVDVKISTFVFRADPEPVISLYDFIMKTFVPKDDTSSTTAPEQQQTELVTSGQNNAQSGKIKVLVNLASVQVILMNDTTQISTLSLSTAQVAVFLHQSAMRVTGRLGSLALSDDSIAEVILPDFKQIMSIEGENFVDFRYETYDITDPSYDGIKSSVYLNVASLRMHYLEQPLHDIYVFMTKLARFKGLYDAATQAAVQSASEIDRMAIEVLVRSPIIIFPSDPSTSKDVLILRLGEINAKNAFNQNDTKTTASLRGIQFSSSLYHDQEASILKIVDDIDIATETVQAANIDREQENDRPDTQVGVTVSDVRLHLTQRQYVLLVALSQSIPRVLAGASEGTDQVQSSVSSQSPSTPDTIESNSQPQVALNPELNPIPNAGIRVWSSLDVVVTVGTVKLHLYDELAMTEAGLKEHGIVRFALNHNSLRYKMLSDGSGEAQIILKSFTINNTRQGSSKFREIIPAAQHDRNQFMILYTMSGGRDSSSMAVLTIDSPQIIFAIEPVIALLTFFSSAFSTPSPAEEPQETADDTLPVDKTPQTNDSGSRIDFRIDLHDVFISVLENDTDINSQAIRLTIKQIQLSQQGILALSIDHLGMSLIRMGKSSENVRFLDDVDLTLSLDSRNSLQQQVTTIELNMKPVVFRASYRDINLIMSIINSAITMYGASQTNKEVSDGSVSSTAPTKSVRTKSRPSLASAGRSSQPLGKAMAITSKEQLSAEFDGFRLVLIGDMHEQPMLHLKVRPFSMHVKDWSRELHAATTLGVHVNYWNLANSHWEPLMDPWELSATVSKPGSSEELKIMLSSTDRLDLNVSTTFVELLLSTLNHLGQNHEHVLQRARGSVAPYKIRNHTGTAVVVWTDYDGSSSIKENSSIQINHGQTVDWRFDDWKTMREHMSSERHNIGIQFTGKSWEPVRSVPVDREGEYTFSLRPKTEKLADRVVCEVTVEDNIKIITIRSTYKIENQTLYPLELTLVNKTGQPTYSVEKIAPGQEYALPLEAVTKSNVRIQPDRGFGYKWCSAIRWEDLISRKAFTINCPHADPNEADFRFQAWALTDGAETPLKKLPKINLKLRAPIEIENLLPYNIQYRIYDKNTNQNWKSYLRKGGVMPVHSVELGHLVLLNIEIQDTIFKPSDFSIINTDGHADFDIEKRISLKDQAGRTLDLRLNYVRYPDSGGAFRVQVYSPYLVVNKTGLSLGIRATRSSRQPQDVAGDTRPEIMSQTTPFMLSHVQDRGNEFSFRLGNSSWSKALSLEAPSAETALSLPLPNQSQKTQEVQIGVAWVEGQGKYKLTKVITITPRFLVRNNLAEPILFREHGVPPSERPALEAGERRPLLSMRSDYDKLLTMAFPGLNAQWSTPINIEDIGPVHFRLKHPRDSVDHIIRADIQLDSSTIFITLSASEGSPFSLENDSDYDISFSQTAGESEGSNRPQTLYNLPKKSQTNYVWDYPASREKKIQLVIFGARRTVDIKEIGDLVPFKFNDGQRVRAVSLDVRADGPKQVLHISNYNAQKSLYKPKARNTPTRTDTISNADSFEAVTRDVGPSLSFETDFAGIGLSLMNRKLVEVIYLSVDRLKLEYTSSEVAQSVNLSLGSLQIDNQLHDAIFPVILQPTPLPKDSNGGVAALPTVQMSVIWLNDQEHGVLFIKYCSILLQALTIEVDEDLLFTIYDLTKIKGISWEDEKQDILIAEPDAIPDPRPKDAGQSLYFEVLELQPIRLSASFMRTERVSSDEKLSIRNPVAVVLNALTMTVGNINDAPLELNALAIKDIRLTMPVLQERITHHYRQEVLRQLYRILGSADFIGNPVGLFNNVASGVTGLFYEPYQGVVMHGNRELGAGIAKGAASFVKKTVFGLSDSFTKVTSSVGKGLSSATFDSEYQSRRRLAQRRNRPRHVLYGVTSGGEAFVNSVGSAMEGVVMKPLEGAETGGAVGFFKGMGKGLVGAVTKPMVGVFDLASNVAEGVRNTTTVFDNPERDRVRIPRLVPADGVLRPYSSREAQGQYWMMDLDNGAYRNEAYVAHINIPGGDSVVLLTTTRVLAFSSRQLRLIWDLPLTGVKGVTVEDTGIRFTHKAGKEFDRFVGIPDKQVQSWFFNQIASVVKTFNANRRMDG